MNLFRYVGFNVGVNEGNAVGIEEGIVDGEVDRDGPELDDGAEECVGRRECVGSKDVDGVELGEIEGKLEDVGLDEGNALGCMDSLGEEEGRSEGDGVGGSDTTNGIVAPRGRTVASSFPFEAASLLAAERISTPAITDTVAAPKLINTLPPTTPSICRRRRWGWARMISSRSTGILSVRSAIFHDF